MFRFPVHFEEKRFPPKKDAGVRVAYVGRRDRRVRRGAVGRSGRVCPEPARTASGPLRRALRQAQNLKLYQSWASRSSDSSAWKRTEGRTREGRGESSGKEAFIDSVAVQAISSRMKAEKVLKVFILRDL